jgi:hypothetical protein
LGVLKNVESVITRIKGAIYMVQALKLVTFDEFIAWYPEIQNITTKDCTMGVIVGNAPAPG